MCVHMTKDEKFQMNLKGVRLRRALDTVCPVILYDTKLTQSSRQWVYKYIIQVHDLYCVDNTAEQPT